MFDFTLLYTTSYCGLNLDNHVGIGRRYHLEDQWSKLDLRVLAIFFDKEGLCICCGIEKDYLSEGDYDLTGDTYGLRECDLKNLTEIKE